MRKKEIEIKRTVNILSNQKGMALLTTLIFVFILVTFAVALLTMTSNDTKLSALQRDSTKAFYIAEAGIEKALYILKNDYESDQDWTGITVPPSKEGDFDEGTFTVYLSNLSSNNVTIKSKGVVYNKSTRYVQVDNAIFAGSGQSGKVINGNVDIRGSVHILGTEGTVAVEALDITGTAGIGNNYDGMDSDLRTRIPSNIPTTIELNGDTVETLNAKLRVKHGTVDLSGTATVGDPDVCSYDEYYNKYGLHLPVSISSITSDTASFYYPEGNNPDTNGNYIKWDQDTEELIISGIIVVDEGCIDFAIGKKGDLIEYEGKVVAGTMKRGTIVSKGDISIHGDLLAKDLFPTTNVLGLIAYNDINLATGSGDSQLKMMGAFYAQNKITSKKQNQIAGTFVSDSFDMGLNVPKIFQVPGLENNLPPGMPGATLTYTYFKFLDWRTIFLRGCQVQHLPILCIPVIGMKFMSKIQFLVRGQLNIFKLFFKKKKDF
jgi:Tfp pilus assembly protein PilX